VAMLLPICKLVYDVLCCGQGWWTTCGGGCSTHLFFIRTFVTWCLGAGDLQKAILFVGEYRAPHLKAKESKKQPQGLRNMYRGVALIG
jgi:hypothetical protein